MTTKSDPHSKEQESSEFLLRLFVLSFSCRCSDSFVKLATRNHINISFPKGNEEIWLFVIYRWKSTMSLDYNKLLERAYANLPKAVGTGERFEIPRVVGIRMGRRTIIQNFGDISNKINREPHHLLKFLSRELATAASLDGARAIFQGRFDVGTVTRLLNIYAQRYVICPICNRPDTKIEKEGRYLFLRCEACGARSSILPV